MRSEREKMLTGKLYDALDPELGAARNRARDLCQVLNASREGDPELRRFVCTQLVGKGGQTVWMQPPFYCEYGSNIELGDRVFFNFNCIVLDVCRVTIGNYTMFGPAV
jgi:maltose O-acetyltransferase